MAMPRAVKLTHQCQSILRRVRSMTFLGVQREAAAAAGEGGGQWVVQRAAAAAAGEGGGQWVVEVDAVFSGHQAEAVMEVV